MPSRPNAGLFHDWTTSVRVVYFDAFSEAGLIPNEVSQFCSQCIREGV